VTTTPLGRQMMPAPAPRRPLCTTTTLWLTRCTSPVSSLVSASPSPTCMPATSIRHLLFSLVLAISSRRAPCLLPATFATPATVAPLADGDCQGGWLPTPQDFHRRWLPDDRANQRALALVRVGHRRPGETHQDDAAHEPSLRRGQWLLAPDPQPAG